MLTILLYNCGLELLDSLPEKILKHPAIKNDIKKRRKKPSEILLDLAIHQSAFTTKEQMNKGRPDIVHQCLLQYLFSPLVHPSTSSEPTRIRMLVHTVANKYFEVHPAWRPPVHFLRFRGLMEKFLKKKILTISSDETITLNSSTVGQIIKKEKPSKILLFSSNSKGPLTLREFAQIITNLYDTDDSILCLIGGYQHGKTPESLLKQLKDSHILLQEISIEGGRLPSWKVINIVLQGIEWQKAFK